MKIKVNEEKEEFQPIKIELTIESRKELEYLWNNLNLAAPKVINKSLTDNKYPLDPETPNLTYGLWDKIDDILHSLDNQVK